ncbi:hypothetical protein [Neisseria animalis]|uniref:Uncharacterized protein n=1 Tax=Neisseria animalis TaxID=492 RepID=A0A5P3MU90_NEIAN|nr:hypothetical protein [Neisseria animalis]QEY24229.1 hypothetical protein D0T90_06785 [Neisseria animalis]ROW32366.1 hypothetical protein CGZ60_05910 [Neisseria animalis]VEE06567.1 Uncharacterised protein [Neisseria animalis]
MYTVNDVFQRLRRVSRLCFESRSLAGSKMDWNCCGNGETLTGFADGVLTFSDRFRLDNGRICRDEKQWRQEEGGLAFYHYREQRFQRIFLFRETENGLLAEQPYACMPDDYFGSLTVCGGAVVLTIRIVGSRKNELIRYEYR